MVHRPDDRMFSKKAVILTDAVGIFNGGAQKDLKTSLTWLGVSDIKKLGIGLLEGVIWNELSKKRRHQIIQKTQKLAKRYQRDFTVRKSIKISTLFFIMTKMHQGISKKENPLSADNQYWLDKGWIKR
ncbi:hypothetical protein SDC9_151019 [bioreactor metagenome]|uniref:Uncharacterized protein n=1 Tax=bioreactor metagenome TaxID=1076179 RepID=A0A645EP37_9ZZZZ